MVADVSSDMVGDGPARSHRLEMGYSGARPFPHANLSEVAAVPGCAHQSCPRSQGLCTKVVRRPPQPTGHPLSFSETSKPQPGPTSHCGAAARPGRPAHCARRLLWLQFAPQPQPALGPPRAAALAPCRSGGGTECWWLEPGATCPRHVLYLLGPDSFGDA